MFRRSNLHSAYKKFAKYVKPRQEQAKLQGIKQINMKNLKKIYDGYVTNSANLMQNSRHLVKCRKLLSSTNVVETADKSPQEIQSSTVEEYKECNGLLYDSIFSKLKHRKLNLSAAVLGMADKNPQEIQRNTVEECKQWNGSLYDSMFSRFKEKKLYLSAAAVAGVGSTSDPIPEPPPIPEPSSVTDTVAEAATQLNALGEATFASLGLGGWTPVGIVQNCFEYLHVTLGIPWWEAIVIGTLFIRMLMLPLVIISQRNAARMNNYLPQLQTIQLKLTEARQNGNELEAARYSQELMLFMKEKGLNPLKNMIVPLAQMPIFISFFVGLREMANTPVESLKTGGLFWFTDLTVPDQYFAMPIITSLTLWATIELGTDSAKLSSQNLQVMAYVLRAIPLVILPFTVNFPGAILCYWLSSNVISLAQVGILRLPGVREFFKIEALIKHNPANLPIKRKGFKEGLQESWTNIKITKQLEERKRLDEIQFQRAGKGPVVKTYSYDPTSQSSTAANAISAKKR